MPQRRPIAQVTAGLAAVMTLAACGATAPVDLPDAPTQPMTATGSSFFATSKVWAAPVPADAPADPRSARYLAKMAALNPVVTLRTFTVTVLVADDTAPRQTITPTAANRLPAGYKVDNVPIPPQMTVDPADNGHLAILDNSSRCVYEMYKMEESNGGWTAEWANATPAEGDGVYPDGLSARGSGFASSAGLIWPDELESGEIPHALVFGYPFTRSGGPVEFATRSDGRDGESAALPIGAHLVLDPTVDVDALGLPREERAIAVALQRYGMVLGDTSDGFTLYAVNPRSFAANPYASTWGDVTYVDLSKIPFNRMKVLALGDQRPRYTGPPVSNRCTAGSRPS